MHGNVSEWCQDGFHLNYNGAPTDGRAWVNDNTVYRLLRGGSWIGNPVDCRSASRDCFIRAERDKFIDFTFGFRVLCAVGRILQ
ncbi:MAG: SUMF1/EgtB/PvdO family nonheme iron enzyme [Desmonostoc geniculatum HA4340-LM1]|nr:SUMF1/EgtB/PvdO family nonheme iron enzyme [Desmonostoc geniculatum HA4340-LM1]